MCARYLTFEAWKDAVFFEIAPYTQARPTARQIRPADLAPVFVQKDGHVSAEAMRWGFPMQRSAVIFNARAETLEEKNLFRDAYRLRRCLVPAAGFYEWNSQSGERCFFRGRENEILYMAGIYQEKAEDSRFVIVTTRACAPVSEVHMRMPLVLHAGQAIQWLGNMEQAERLRSSAHIVPLIQEPTAEFLHPVQQYKRNVGRAGSYDRV